jgi:hypothetical protein
MVSHKVLSSFNDDVSLHTVALRPTLPPGLSLGIKQQGYEDHSPICSTDVKNGEAIPSLHSYNFILEYYELYDLYLSSI